MLYIQNVCDCVPSRTSTHTQLLLLRSFESSRVYISSTLDITTYPSGPKWTRHIYGRCKKKKKSSFPFKHFSYRTPSPFPLFRVRYSTFRVRFRCTRDNFLLSSEARSPRAINISRSDSAKNSFGAYRRRAPISFFDRHAVFRRGGRRGKKIINNLYTVRGLIDTCARDDDDETVIFVFKQYKAITEKEKKEIRMKNRVSAAIKRQSVPCISR